MSERVSNCKRRSVRCLLFPCRALSLPRRPVVGGRRDRDLGGVNLYECWSVVAPCRYVRPFPRNRTPQRVGIGSDSNLSPLRPSGGELFVFSIAELSGEVFADSRRPSFRIACAGGVKHRNGELGNGLANAQLSVGRCASLADDPVLHCTSSSSRRPGIK